MKVLETTFVQFIYLKYGNQGLFIDRLGKYVFIKDISKDVWQLSECLQMSLWEIRDKKERNL